jgi:hypothetical protein
MPILLQPCGAVPKGTAPFYRLITDARFANKFYSDWGVTYTTAAQLNRCDFHFSIVISDAYHLSLWAGCGGELRPVQRPVIVSNGPGQPSEVSWVDAMVNGCTPSTCRGGCDKDLSGILIDGFVFRFAACRARVRRSETFIIPIASCIIPIASCLQGTILAPTPARPPRPAAWLMAIRHFG